MRGELIAVRCLVSVLHDPYRLLDPLTRSFYRLTQGERRVGACPCVLLLESMVSDGNMMVVGVPG